MRLDTTIVEMYFNGITGADIKNHWIFYSIKEGGHLYEIPDLNKRDKIQFVYEQVLNCLKYFQVRNKYLFDSVFPNNKITENDEIVIYLIVGAPSPYDAMCRKDGSGRLCIIFDLIRIKEYCNDIEQIQDIIENLITHELIHAYIRKDYPSPSLPNDFVSELKYIVFDEGFAHYLSLSNNILEFNFYKYRNKREVAFYKLKEAFRNNTGMNNEILIETNTGKFWDKFGAIAGMFGVSEYLGREDDPCSKIADLYSKGPDFLSDYIISMIE